MRYIYCIRFLPDWQEGGGEKSPFPFSRKCDMMMLTAEKGGMRVRRFLAGFLAGILYLAALCVSAGAEVYINGTVPDDWHERELLRLTQFKIGANDGMLLEAGGQTMLIDGGTSGFHDEIMGGLTARGITRVDYLFNTHPHDDHIDSQYMMIQKDGLTADVFLSAFPRDFNEERQRKMAALLEEKNIPFRQVSDGETMEMGMAKLTFIQAPQGDLNARSCMLHIRYGEKSTMLLTADVSGASQHYFVAQTDAALLDVDILKMPHHGLIHMVPDFVEKTSPAFVFITNRSSVIPRTNSQLAFRKIPHLHTALGTLVIETDGTDWYVFQEKGVF